jgi:DNA polymerase beta
MTEPIDHRPKIIAELDILRRISALESAGVFKARSYAAAIKALQDGPPLHALEDLPPPRKGDSLGKQIREKIAKIMETGSLDIPAETRTMADSLEAFLGIYGVGPKKAEDLIKSGYKTIAELRAAATANPKLFNKNQKIGLQYYEDLQLRIPRAEMDQHAATLMAAKPAALDGVIVGSYRRGRPDSGDIDMLIRTSSPDVNAGEALTTFVDLLKSKGYIKEVLALGEHKCLAIARIGNAPARRLDLLVTPPAEFPFAVLYFTGSDGFNVRMRAHALERGFTLNEHAITQVSTGRSVTGIKTEQDIFKLLKMEWREPVDRTGPEAVCIL